jgi:predicted MFS family arabinose efflux permease
MTYKNINKKGIRITLLLISLCQLGSLAISSVISDITKAFPAVSDQTAQFLMTFPGLFILITSLLSASLTRIISQKKLAIAGLILNVVTAVGGLLLHGNIILLFCWAATLGLGLGLWMPIVSAMVSTTGADCAVFAHEKASGDWKVSLRSNKVVNVSAIAEAFGGGGHFHASGCTISRDRSIDFVLHKMVEMVRDQLADAGKGSPCTTEC